MANRNHWCRVFTRLAALALIASPIDAANAEAAAPEPAAKTSTAAKAEKGTGKSAGVDSGKSPSAPTEIKSSPPPASPVESGSKSASQKPEAATGPATPRSETGKPVKQERTSRSKHRRPGDTAAADAKVGQGPSPASPPPLTMGGLREEMNREAAPVAIDADAPPRTKVEQMLTEITKARQALHDDTIRLEGMMAQDGSESAPAGPGNSGPAPAAGRPVAKNPLDVLAKALRGIKPDQAAPIVARLDKRLAATVLQRMPPVDAGKIMGAMKPDTAAELATQIAMRVMPSEVKR